jgi:hypothetical protein
MQRQSACFRSRSTKGYLAVTSFDAFKLFLIGFILVQLMGFRTRRHFALRAAFLALTGAIFLGVFHFGLV